MKYLMKPKRSLFPLFAIRPSSQQSVQRLQRNSSTAKPTTPPKKFEPFLTNCKLQTPVAKVDGNGVIEIQPSEIMGFSSEHFYGETKRKTLIFKVPDDGATTPGSSYPRCELRDLREWTMEGNEVHTLRGSLKILQVPASGRIIFSQIHGVVGGSECLKMEWANGSIYLRTKATVGGESVKSVIQSGLNLGDLVEFYISISNYQLIVTVNGYMNTTTFDDSWTDKNLYFKAGNYIQDNSDSGTSGEVAYYKLSDN